MEGLTYLCPNRMTHFWSRIPPRYLKALEMICFRALTVCTSSITSEMSYWTTAGQSGTHMSFPSAKAGCAYMAVRIAVEMPVRKSLGGRPPTCCKSNEFLLLAANRWPIPHVHIHSALTPIQLLFTHLQTVRFSGGKRPVTREVHGLLSKSGGCSVYLLFLRSSPDRGRASKTS